MRYPFCKRDCLKEDHYAGLILSTVLLDTSHLQHICDNYSLEMYGFSGITLFALRTGSPLRTGSGRQLLCYRVCVCVCVCVCERERERERETVCACVCVNARERERERVHVSDCACVCLCKCGCGREGWGVSRDRGMKGWQKYSCWC